MPIRVNQYLDRIDNFALDNYQLGRLVDVEQRAIRILDSHTGGVSHWFVYGRIGIRHKELDGRKELYG